MQTKNKITLARNTVYGIVLLAVFLSAFGAGNLPAARAQEETPETPTPTNEPTACYTLDLVVAEGEGTLNVITPQNCEGGYLADTLVEISAVADTGFIVFGWSGTDNDLSTDSKNSLRMVENTEVLVYFHEDLTNLSTQEELSAQATCSGTYSLGEHTTLGSCTNTTTGSVYIYFVRAPGGFVDPSKAALIIRIYRSTNTMFGMSADRYGVGNYVSIGCCFDTSPSNGYSDIFDLNAIVVEEWAGNSTSIRVSVPSNSTVYFAAATLVSANTSDTRVNAPVDTHIGVADDTLDGIKYCSSENNVIYNPTVEYEFLYTYDLPYQVQSGWTVNFQIADTFGQSHSFVVSGSNKCYYESAKYDGGGMIIHILNDGPQANLDYVLSNAQTYVGAPSPLTASAVSSSSINLSWPDNSNEIYFHIERSNYYDFGWSEITTRPSGTTTYTDLSVTCGLKYFYRIRAETVIFAYSDWVYSNSNGIIAPCNNPPNTPSAPTPSHNANNVPVTQALSWSGGDPDSGNTVTYNVYLKLSTAGSYALVCSNISQTNCNPAGDFEYSKTYNWYIVATDNLGASSSNQSSPWTFSTGSAPNNPPNTPSAPTPSHNANNVPVTQILSWSGGDPDSGNTVTYNVYLKLSTAGSYALVCSNISQASCNPSGDFEYSKTYNWYVVATDNLGASSSNQGSPWTFSTGAVPNNPPYTPSAPTPSHNAGNVPVTQILSWSGGDPDSGNTVTYNVYLKLSTAGSYSLVCSNISQASCNPSGDFEYSKTYNWYVVATDNLGASSSNQSSPWTFSTGAVPNNPPYTPNTPTPSHNASNVSLSQILYWNGGDPDSGNTVTYSVYLKLSTSGSYGLVCSNVSQTSCNPSGDFEYSKTYNWYVVATDNLGASSSNQSSSWTFSTGAAPNSPPYTPNTPEPTHNASNVSLSQILYWNGGDPDSGNTVTYNVYLKLSTASSYNLFCSNYIETYCVSSTVGFEYNKTYNWYVVATDNLGASSSNQSSPWTFSTGPAPNNPPNTPNTPTPSHNANNVPVTQTLSWSGGDPDSGNTVTYNVYLKLSTAGSYGLVCSNISQASCNPSGDFEFSKTYNWYVVATDNLGASSSNQSSPWTFSTGAVPNNPPYTPSAPTPSHNANNVPVTQILSWSGGDPDSGNTVTYNVYLKLSTAGSYGLACSNITQTNCNPSGDFEFSKTYNWYVVATDNLGASSSNQSSPWNFSTGATPNNPPNTPNTPTPSHNANNVPVTQILSWSGGDPDSGNTVTYNVYLKLSTAGSYGLVCSNISQASCNPSGDFEFSKTYNWYVVATDNLGASSSNQSSPWTFSTTANVGACLPASSIAVGGTHSYRNDGAGSTDVIDSYPTHVWNESGSEYAYSFITNAAGQVTVSLSNMSADLDIFILDGSSGNCNPSNAITGGDVSASFSAVSGRTYYFVVDGFVGAVSDYTISVAGPAAAPGAAILVSPTGNIGTNYTPNFVWNAVATATYYRLYVSGPSGVVLDQWYEAANICNTTTCSVASPTTLGGGAHAWYVQTWSPAGYGPWSNNTQPTNFSTTIPTVPPAAVLTAPIGNIGTNYNPNYTWNKVSTATWYHLYVSGPSGVILDQWYQAVNICDTTTCSVASPTLLGGAHVWYVQTYNSAGYGPWSNNTQPTNFNTTPIPLPGAAVLTAPIGNIATNYNPIYTWNKAADAVYYRLYVSGPSGLVLDQWYLASNICNATTCSVASPTPLGGGAHVWYVQTWNTTGYGPWSNNTQPTNFSTTIPTIPVAAVLTAPSGTISNHTPTYTWNRVSMATWYRLYVSGPNGVVKDQWYQAVSICNATTCSVVSPSLPSGAHIWYVQAYNVAGYSPWASSNFTVSP